jgi:hypothetical protein
LASEKIVFVNIIVGMKPILLITIGPTGSGKTALIDESIKQLHHPGEWHQYLIDDYVENDAIYKKRVLDILTSQLQGKLDTLIQPTPNLYSEFNDAYFSVRKSLGCGRAGKGGCDAQFDEDIDAAIMSGQNVVFETTGTYYPAWLAEKTQGRYQIVLSYTLVNLCDLVRRNTNRAVASAKKFISNPVQIPAPRLPNVSASGPYRDNVSKIRQVFFDIVNNNCLSKSKSGSPLNTQFCSPYPISKIFLFDNNKYPMQLVATLQQDSPLDTDKLNNIFDNFMNTTGNCLE